MLAQSRPSELFFENPGAIWTLIGAISVRVFEAYNLIYFVRQ
jgi:hypothetical protein